MTIADIVIIAVIGLMLCGIGYHFYKRKKAGKGGCSRECSGCNFQEKCK